MTHHKLYTLLTLLFVSFSLGCKADNEGIPTETLYSLFRAVPDSCRTKVWWVFGDAASIAPSSDFTRDDAVKADIDALGKAGLRGIVASGLPNDYIDVVAKEIVNNGMTFDITTAYPKQVCGYELSPFALKVLFDESCLDGSFDRLTLASTFQPSMNCQPLNTCGGQEYAINRANPYLPYMRQLFDYEARCRLMLHQGALRQSTYSMIHRSMPAADIFMIINQNEDPRYFHQLLPTMGSSAEYWNAMTGERLNIPLEMNGGNSYVDITLGAHESAFIIVRHDGADNSLPKYTLPEPVGNSRVLLPLAERWTQQFDVKAMYSETTKTIVRDNAFCYLHPRRLESWTEYYHDNRLRYYSGTVAYRSQFDVTTLTHNGKNAKVMLSIPRLDGVATVFINEQEAGSLWFLPFDIDISKYIKKGRNSIEIKVVNSLHNRLLYDALIPEEERINKFTAPIPSYEYVDPAPSGITGDVSIYMY